MFAGQRINVTEQRLQPVELLAAIPSVVLGLWAIFVMEPFLRPFLNGMHHALGWLPFFSTEPQGPGMAPAILILVVIAIPSFRLVFFLDRAQNPDMTLKVVAHQWYWEYAYPGEGDLAILDVKARVGKAVEIAGVIVVKMGDDDVLDRGRGLIRVGGLRDRFGVLGGRSPRKHAPCRAGQQPAARGLRHASRSPVARVR